MLSETWSRSSWTSHWPRKDGRTPAAMRTYRTKRRSLQSPPLSSGEWSSNARNAANCARCACLEAPFRFLRDTQISVCATGPSSAGGSNSYSLLNAFLIHWHGLSLSSSLSILQELSLAHAVAPKFQASQPSQPSPFGQAVGSRPRKARLD